MTGVRSLKGSLKTFSPRAIAIVAGVVVVLDQVTKWLAIKHLTLSFRDPSGNFLGFKDSLNNFLWNRHPLRDEAVEVVANFWHFRYVENPGAAFGFLSRMSESYRTPFFLCVSIVAMTSLILYLRSTTRDQVLVRVAIALVLGGALGNFLDRLHLNYVIDFIDWHLYDKYTWPTFNVADSAITVGACLLMISIIIDMVRGEPAREQKRGV